MLNLYRNVEFFFLSDNEQILNMQGMILIKNGYIKEIAKLNIVFSASIICVFW